MFTGIQIRKEIVVHRLNSIRRREKRMNIYSNGNGILETQEVNLKSKFDLMSDEEQSILHGRKF